MYICFCLLEQAVNHYFSHRIVSVWNSLPDSVVSAESVNKFQIKIRQVLVYAWLCIWL